MKAELKKKNSWLSFSIQIQTKTYDFTVPFFSWGSAEELLLFNKKGQLVCQGQNIINGLIQGDAFTAFNQVATVCGNKPLQI